MGSTVVIPLKIKKKTKQHDAAEEVNNVIDLEECTAYKVVDMLKDEALCEALVTWMMREFSVENVLSFMEMVHFKRHVKKIKDNQATIAAEEATDTANVTAVEEVQVKYIEFGSLFEINIGYGLRGKYENCDGNNWTMSVDELLCVFDEAMLEAHHTCANHWEDGRSICAKRVDKI